MTTTDNIYLNRLKEQYKTAKENLNRTLIPMQSYNAMRLFFIECELLTFNEIEVMEYEVNIEVNNSLSF